jgi:hypothetical protein
LITSSVAATPSEKVGSFVQIIAADEDAFYKAIEEAIKKRDSAFANLPDGIKSRASEGGPHVSLVKVRDKKLPTIATNVPMETIIESA